MKTSGAGIRFIQSFEKCSLEKYDDQGGKPTIGYGHLITGSEIFSDEITQDQADALFLSDLAKKAEEPVLRHLDIILSQNQFDALVSLCFNIGSGNFSGSTILRKVNMKDPSAADEFPKWDKVNGEVSKGLYARRIAEQNIFENGVYNNHL